MVRTSRIGSKGKGKGKESMAWAILRIFIDNGGLALDGRLRGFYGGAHGRQGKEGVARLFGVGEHCVRYVQ